VKQLGDLVRLERCSSLAGESPVVVIAREPRSNPPVPWATGGAEARESTPRRRSDTAVRTMKRNPAAPISLQEGEPSPSFWGEGQGRGEESGQSLKAKKTSNKEN